MQLLRDESQRVVSKRAMAVLAVRGQAEGRACWAEETTACCEKKEAAETEANGAEVGAKTAPSPTMERRSWQASCPPCCDERR